MVQHICCPQQDLGLPVAEGDGRGNERTVTSGHVMTYLFIKRFIDIAEVMRSKLQEALQLLPWHLLHYKPVVCNGNGKGKLTGVLTIRINLVIPLLTKWFEESRTRLSTTSSPCDWVLKRTNVSGKDKRMIKGLNNRSVYSWLPSALAFE